MSSSFSRQFHRMPRLAGVLPGLAVTLFSTAFAIEVNPSKETLPPSAWESHSNHFSIFDGDPKRIQRANEVDPKYFDCKVEVTPDPLSLKDATKAGSNPSIKITFSVHNHSPKRTFTLSFPTAQRWDFRILDAAGAVVYSYTDDHDFVQAVGTSMADPDDKLVYEESVAFHDLKSSLRPGTYTVQAVLANYPLFAAKAELKINP